MPGDWLTEFTKYLIAASQLGRTMSDQKHTDPAKPEQPRAAHHYPYSARLWVLDLPAGADDYPFVLLFDQWVGPKPSPGTVDDLKRQTGARGVLFLEGSVSFG